MLSVECVGCVCVMCVVCGVCGVCVVCVVCVGGWEGRKRCGWRPPFVDADWHAFCQAIYKGIESSEWEVLYEHYKEMSKAAGVRDLMTQNARTTFWGDIRRDWNCGKSTSKTHFWTKL